MAVWAEAGQMARYLNQMSHVMYSHLQALVIFTSPPTTTLNLT